MLLVVLALAGSAFLAPDPEVPEFEPTVGAAPPPVAVCPVDEGSGRSTEIAVLSTVDGPAGLALFAAGGSAGSLESSTGATGSLVIPVVDVAAVGTVGGLVEMPVASSAAGTRILGTGSLRAEACASLPEPQVFISGGSTADGEMFELQLMNPYAGEAVVELIVQSEAGTESNSRFESVIVPPRSSTFVDFADLTPGRESLSVAIETVTGRVNAVGLQTGSGETALWNAVAGATDWFLPIPKGGPVREVILATPANTEIDYEVDLFTPDGAEEGFASGRLSARGQHVVDMSEVTDEAVGLRVVSTGPVVPTIRLSGEGFGISMTTGASSDSNRWFLPGARAPEGGWATVVLFNGGIEDAEVRIRALRESTSTRTIAVASETVVALGIESADGYLIESTNPIVSMWNAQREGSSSVAIGVPLTDE